MKKKLISLALALALVLSFSSVALAESGPVEVEPQNTDSIIFEIERISASKADVYATVYFSQTVNVYNVVVYLQKKVDGEWQLDFSNPERTLYNNGFQDDSFSFYNQYTGLERGASYRIHLVSRDTIGDDLSIFNAYSNPF